MKKLLFAFLVLLAMSCSRQTEEKTSVLKVGIASSSVMSKATIAGTADENKVNSLQVFVYKKSGDDFVFEAMASASSDQVTISVTGGEKKIAAVVNETGTLPYLDGAEAVMAAANRLKENAPDSFLMAGVGNFTIRPTSRSVSVPVDRITARVKLAKLTNSLQNGLEGKSFKLSRVFLTRTASQSNFLGSPSSGAFYALSGIGTNLDLDRTAVGSDDEKTAVNKLIYKNVSSENIANGASLDINLPLYAYPNDGSTQKTRFVAEVQIDGKYYTYPIEFETIEANCTYEIVELRIKSVGNPSDGDDEIEGSEDEPVEIETATFGVEVQNWEIKTVSNGDDGKYTI